MAIHPLSIASPDEPARSSLDISIADAAKVTGLLAAARRLHTVLPAGPKALWVTELNWESFPAAADGVPAALQAAWISRALHRLWVAGVSVVMWSFLVDPDQASSRRRPRAGPSPIRPAGLYAAGPDGNSETATAKPFLTGFRFPFDPLRTGARKIRLWALADEPREPLSLQRLERGGVWRTIAHLRAGSAGVLNVLLTLRGRATLRLLGGGLAGAPATVERLPAGSRQQRHLPAFYEAVDRGVDAGQGREQMG